MRSITDYRIAEWMAGTPLVHGFKLGRNRLIGSYFCAQDRAKGAALIESRPELAAKTLICVIAFNVPWIIELLLGSAGRLTDAALVIFDNSRDPAARREIERICRERDTAYLALPFNPERHPCRSHGLSMNWAYYNVVRVAKPRVFAFLDHDLVPTAVYDLADKVARQPVYGLLKQSSWGWHLWAGFCVFDFARVGAYRLDFNHDIPRRLDTGGRNWQALYRHLDRPKIAFAKSEPSWIAGAGDDEPALAEIIDDTLLHIAGVGHGIRRFAPVRPQLYKSVMNAIGGGADISQFLVAPP